MTSDNEGATGTGLEFSDLGGALIDLGANLQALGEISAKRSGWDPREDLYVDSLDEIDRLVYLEARTSEKHDAMSQTLNGLRKFRTEYDHLERMIASYAMQDMGFSQRRTGTLLGYSGATMNRLSQSARDDED